jgi:hypothetical protein
MLVDTQTLVSGFPLNRRFLSLFGLSISNPADLSGLYNIKVPGDATGYLDITHQQHSASATGTGYVQHQGHNGPGCKTLHKVEKVSFLFMYITMRWKV